VESSINYALASSSQSLPSEPMSTRLPELLLLEILRVHLATAPAIERGWIAALRDPILAPAMAQLHAAPDRKWTVAELAASVAVSRSLLDERFRQVLGRSPIRYLTDWRMHIAEELLATTREGVAAISRRVGYDSEEAFSRAFKRAHAISPSMWRTLNSRSHHEARQPENGPPGMRFNVAALKRATARPSPQARLLDKQLGELGWGNVTTNARGSSRRAAPTTSPAPNCGHLVG